MSETDISVFVDESGTFDSDKDSSRFYLICLVLHDQRESIAREVVALEDSLAAIGLEREHCIHAGPRKLASLSLAYKPFPGPQAFHWRASLPCHHPGCLGSPVGLGRPPENEIPSGRPANP